MCAVGKQTSVRRESWPWSFHFFYGVKCLICDRYSTDCGIDKGEKRETDLWIEGNKSTPLMRENLNFKVYKSPLLLTRSLSKEQDGESE